MAPPPGKRPRKSQPGSAQDWQRAGAPVGAVRQQLDEPLGLDHRPHRGAAAFRHDQELGDAEHAHGEQRDVEAVEQAEDVEGEALGAVDRVLPDGREQEFERDHQQRVDLRSRRQLRHQQQAEQHERRVLRRPEG